MNRPEALICYVVLAVLAASGCDHTSTCEKACSKMAKCLGLPDAGSISWKCQFTEQCTSAEKCHARCVTKSSVTCDVILGTDPVGGAEYLKCVAGCPQISKDSGPDLTPSPDLFKQLDQNITPDTGPKLDLGFPIKWDVGDKDYGSILTCQDIDDCVSKCSANKACQQNCINSAPPSAQFKYYAYRTCVTNAPTGACASQCDHGSGSACTSCVNMVCKKVLDACFF